MLFQTFLNLILTLAAQGLVYPLFQFSFKGSFCTNHRHLKSLLLRQLQLYRFLMCRRLPYQPGLFGNLNQHVRVIQPLHGTGNLFKRICNAVHRVRVCYTLVNHHVFLAPVFDLFLTCSIQASGDLGNIRVFYNFNAITAVHKVANIILVTQVLPNLRRKKLHNARTPGKIKQRRHIATIHHASIHNKIHKIHALLHGNILLNFHTKFSFKTKNRPAPIPGARLNYNLSFCKNSNRWLACRPGYTNNLPSFCIERVAGRISGPIFVPIRIMLDSIVRIQRGSSNSGPIQS
nr:MAG TPA: hypothetical protein [Caudoviricetes sp.]